jgi:DNA-binding response OmpR family regulator
VPAPGDEGTVTPVAQLLLVEDDAEIRRGLMRGLAELGHAVVGVASGYEALKEIVDQRPDLVVLDLGLPDIDGGELLRMVRAVSSIPVVVATARGEEEVIVALFNSGADDYLVKPFGPAQLDARVRAVLRRTGSSVGADEPMTIGRLRIDLAAREVTLYGAAIELAPREFDLLAFLAARVGTVVTRRELLTQVWRQPYTTGDDTVDVHLSWLRRKLGESAREPRYLHTVRGVGVKLAPPREDVADPPTP